MDVCAAIGYPGAVGNPGSKAAINCEAAEVTTFNAASGGLGGTITRKYFAENIFGGGLGYVISAEPGSLLDQLIINVEAQYTPKRTFTSPDLSPVHPVTKNELTTALVMEKYQRFFINLPATYMVFQWEHKTRSDLYGRFIGTSSTPGVGGGMGGDAQHAGHGVGGGSDYFVFAFQQPFPNLIWRFDMSVLGDKRGGILVQPALRWKPNGNWTANLFYNYLNGHLGTPNENIISSVDWAKEITIRIGYQF